MKVKWILLTFPGLEMGIFEQTLWIGMLINGSIDTYKGVESPSLEDPIINIP